MPRLDGWEARLYATIEAARVQTYALGEHDCFRLACRVVEALTGADRWPEFAGYRTKREAVATLAAHGSTFEAAFDWFFGGAHFTDARLARRGDVVGIADASGEKHLGICLGGQAAYLAPEGLIFLPLKAAHCGWKVG